MKKIEVSCAIIIKNRKTENADKKELFATQRGYGEYKDGWEFPGGKLEKEESPEQCIEREIREELATEIKSEKNIGTVEYDYPDFHITMHCILCKIISGNLTLLEHEDAKWLSKEDIDSVDWLPADRLILDEVKKLL